MMKAADDFDRAVAKMTEGVDVFSFQELETAVTALAGLFQDVDADAADEDGCPGE